ncbi:iron ABC transporter permease [Gluconobacter thailandicus]|uniref:Iron ABC transporter permease n=1 Tax=Gluconobacter thailandicus TaxID=257438 RepID=A0AAP9EVK0_GLUTH|nr:iron ABC transporter permease [Gluconobacter thailandicus]
MLFSLGTGRYSIPFSTLYSLLRCGAVTDPAAWLVISDVRLPRALMALLAGASLSVCGSVLQGVFRNPLIGPQTIGIASGASVGGAIAIVLAGVSATVMPAAFFGAALALLVVLFLQKADAPQPALTLVLGGIVVSAFCSGLVSAMTFIANPETRLPSLVFWLLGSFATASWGKLAVLTPCVVFCLSILFFMRWRINLLSLGDDEARILGAHPTADRLVVLTMICIVVSAQVAVSGVIGWVGLIIPNLARLIVGADQRRLIPLCALFGATFLTAADTAARTVSPAEIPIGIVTALIGTPVFAVILRRQMSKAYL